jgi:hypothetical protein
VSGDYTGFGRKRFYRFFTGITLWQFATYVPPRGLPSVLAEGAGTTSVKGK